MLFTLRTLRLDEATVGIIIGVGGIGALWGAWAAEPMTRLVGYGRAIVLSITLWTLANVLIPLSEGQDTLKVPFLVTQQLIGDGFLSAFIILALSVRQTALDHDVQARVGATFQLAGGLALPAGALIAGPLADVVGAGAVLWFAIAGALIPLMILVRSPLWTLRRLEETRAPRVISRT
jgi:predicted MFS family arabinose efflux permease